MNAINGQTVSDRSVENYLNVLVNQFFKILPIKESGEKTLLVYMKSLRDELLGFEALFEVFHDDAYLISLTAILQYLIDHDPDVVEVRTSVFKAIDICKKLKKRYEAVKE
jgi:hypothetical protein